jgi:septal ring factor EnvC (AmiA/AmiB activator)
MITAVRTQVWKVKQRFDSLLLDDFGKDGRGDEGRRAEIAREISDLRDEISDLESQLFRLERERDKLPALATEIGRPESAAKERLREASEYLQHVVNLLS